MKKIKTGYTLINYGWVGEYLAKDVTWADVLEAIGKMLPILLGDGICLDNSYVLVLPDGTELRDEQIALWFQQHSGDRP